MKKTHKHLLALNKLLLLIIYHEGEGQDEHLGTKKYQHANDAIKTVNKRGNNMYVLCAYICIYIYTLKYLYKLCN